MYVSMYIVCFAAQRSVVVWFWMSDVGLKHVRLRGRFQECQGALPLEESLEALDEPLCRLNLVWHCSQTLNGECCRNSRRCCRLLVVPIKDRTRYLPCGLADSNEAVTDAIDAVQIAASSGSRAPKGRTGTVVLYYRAFSFPIYLLACRACERANTDTRAQLGQTGILS